MNINYLVIIYRLLHMHILDRSRLFSYSFFFYNLYVNIYSKYKQVSLFIYAKISMKIILYNSNYLYYNFAVV